MKVDSVIRQCQTDTRWRKKAMVAEEMTKEQIAKAQDLSGEIIGQPEVDGCLAHRVQPLKFRHSLSRSRHPAEESSSETSERFYASSEQGSCSTRPTDSSARTLTSSTTLTT
ncbi:MAG: hypothetical protein CMI18_11360 [Opitutaceae bacterium]|nr:hypothetical protein [Opitutaceae bacterium]